jgi:hypothetical protein
VGIGVREERRERGLPGVAVADVADLHVLGPVRADEHVAGGPVHHGARHGGGGPGSDGGVGGWQQRPLAGSAVAAPCPGGCREPPPQQQQQDQIGRVPFVGGGRGGPPLFYPAFVLFFFLLFFFFCPPFLLPSVSTRVTEKERGVMPALALKKAGQPNKQTVLMRKGGDAHAWSSSSACSA